MEGEGEGQGAVPRLHREQVDLKKLCLVLSLCHFCKEGCFNYFGLGSCCSWRGWAGNVMDHY